VAACVAGTSPEDCRPEVCEWSDGRSQLEDAEDNAIEDTSDAADEAADTQEPTSTDDEMADDPETNPNDDPADGSDDIESVSGIGPTYADRLREVGIETTDDLAAADVSTVTDAAEISESRAHDWIDRASN